MNFEKKNNMYKIMMVIIVTALITFMITSIFMYNYYTKTEKGLIKVISSVDTTELDKKIQLVRKCLDKFYLGEIPDEEKLNEYAVKGYVAGLGDEYTEYLTKEEYEELMISVNGNFVGIGIYMTQDKNGDVIVLLPIEGSPAEEAGIKIGDIIKKVDEVSCEGEDLSIIANKIKGKEGSFVNLEILREGEIINKTIERRKVELNTIKAEVIEKNIGYIQILSFDDECSQKFEEKLNELTSKGIKSLIIDVRDNGGGIVTEAVDIAELFTPKGKNIMIEIDKDGKEEITKSKRDLKTSNDLNIVILANENTASASEIFAGALQDNEKAKIIGTKTFGKGVMQELEPMNLGGALKVTIREFRTPNGNIVNKEGIKPDIEVIENKETKSDEQLQRAIEELKK